VRDTERGCHGTERQAGRFTDATSVSGQRQVSAGAGLLEERIDAARQILFHLLKVIRFSSTLPKSVQRLAGVVNGMPLQKVAILCTVGEWLVNAFSLAST